MLQCYNAAMPMHECVNASMHECGNASQIKNQQSPFSNQCYNATMLLCMNAWNRS